MRKLMWFSLGFGAVCALCAYCWLTENLWIPALVLGILCFPALLLSGRIKWLRFAAAIGLGCAAGLLWFQVYSLHYLTPAARLDGKTASAQITVTDYGYETAYGSAVEGVMTVDEKPVRVKAYLEGKRIAEPGDLLDGTFRFRVTTPDGSDEPTAHRGKGIFLLAYEEDAAQILKSDQQSRWTFPARLRHRLLVILDDCFPQDTAAFAKALLLGERTGIDYETNTVFKLSGISHVIAVSGLHVTIVFTLINLLCFKRRFLVALAGIPALVLFAAVAGFSPSITRACIMQCLMILAMVLNREYDGPTELAFSCLVMLILNPLVITSVSFQLSVGCMIGIILFSSRISGYLRDRYIRKGSRLAKLKRWVIGSMAVTLSAMAVTTPLVAYYFGTVSLVGILTNLLTLWIISFIFCGIVAVCVCSSFWFSGACVIAGIVSWPIRYVLAVARLLAALPMSCVYTASNYIVIWLAFCYVLLAVFLAGKRKRPAVFLCCLVISLCLALSASWLEPVLDHCRMSVLDVGQGQCIVLQSEGKTFLVDCGGSDGEEAADTAAEYLLSQGISRLDGVILTHFDSDHSNGLEYLLSRIPADVLIVPAGTDEEATLQHLLSGGQQTVVVKKDVQLCYGTTEFLIFGPAVPNSGNESSLAILFRHDNCDILISGDRSAFGEWILLKTAQIPEVDILVVGHHGSKNATSTQLLAAAKPDTAVISVGENHYGHPSQEVLDRLKEINCEVYRTDLHGSIIFRR